MQIFSTNRHLTSSQKQISGVSSAMRKMANSLCSIIFLARDGTNYIFVSETSFKSSKIGFRLGEEFVEEMFDGRKVPSITVMENDGDRLVQDHKGKHPTRIVRDFDENQCLETITCGDLVCKRWYRIVEACYPHEQDE